MNRTELDTKLLGIEDLNAVSTQELHEIIKGLRDRSLITVYSNSTRYYYDDICYLDVDGKRVLYLCIDPEEEGIINVYPEDINSWQSISSPGALKEVIQVSSGGTSPEIITWTPERSSLLGQSPIVSVWLKTPTGYSQEDVPVKLITDTVGGVTTLQSVSVDMSGMEGVIYLIGDRVSVDLIPEELNIVDGFESSATNKAGSVNNDRVLNERLEEVEQRQISTDPTLKGGGDLSEDRTLGIADNMIPATATQFVGDINTLVTPQERFCSSSSNNTIANGFPVDGLVWSLSVRKDNNASGIAQVLYGHGSGGSAGTISQFTRYSLNGLDWSPWIKLVNDDEVVHRTGTETIQGEKQLNRFTRIGNKQIVNLIQFPKPQTGAIAIRYPISQHASSVREKYVLSILTESSGEKGVSRIEIKNTTGTLLNTNIHLTGLIQSSSDAMLQNLRKTIRTGYDTNYCYYIIGDTTSTTPLNSLVVLEEWLSSYNQHRDFSLVTLTDFTGITMLPPVSITEIATKGWVSANKVDKSGDTMTGTLQLTEGTTTEPPLIIPQGELTTVPQDGALERDAAGDLFITKEGSRLKITTGDLIPYTGANQAVNLNNQNLTNVGTFRAGTTLIPTNTVEVAGKNISYYLITNTNGSPVAKWETQRQSGASYTSNSSYGFGFEALQNNAGAFPNGFGHQALQNNTGFYSNGFGHSALQSNTGTSSNGFGHASLQNNTGYNSSGFGHQALQNNIGSSSNGFGFQALQNNIGRDSNGFGYAALRHNRGVSNNAFGHNVLSDTPGAVARSYITAIGNNIPWSAITKHGQTVFSGEEIIGLDLTNAKINAAAGNALVTKDWVNDQINGGQLDTIYLKLTGGTVTGNIKSSAPVADEDLANKAYVDNAVSTVSNSQPIINTSNDLHGLNRDQIYQYLDTNYGAEPVGIEIYFLNEDVMYKKIIHTEYGASTWSGVAVSIGQASVE